MSASLTPGMSPEGRGEQVQRRTGRRGATGHDSLGGSGPRQSGWRTCWERGGGGAGVPARCAKAPRLQERAGLQDQGEWPKRMTLP